MKNVAQIMIYATSRYEHIAIKALRMMGKWKNNHLYNNSENKLLLV